MYFTGCRWLDWSSNPPKCTFCKECVQFLGHIGSATRVAVDPAKAEKVAKYSIGVDWRVVQQRLGSPYTMWQRRWPPLSELISARKPSKNCDVDLHKLHCWPIPTAWTPLSWMWIQVILGLGRNETRMVLLCDAQRVGSVLCYPLPGGNSPQWPRDWWMRCSAIFSSRAVTFSPR